MKTILHISKYYFPELGGIETVAMYLAEGMTEYRNIVVCFSNNKEYHEDEIRGIKVYRVPVNFSFLSQDVSFSYLSILKKLVAEYKPDFVHLHCPNPFVYPLVVSVIGRDTKLILHWHSDILSKGIMYTLIKPFEEMVLRRADIIISTSPNYVPHSKPLTKYVEKVRIAQNGLIEENFKKKESDIPRIEEIKKTYGNKKIVFFVGRHIPYKGIDILIKADKYIENDCVILIGGKGPLDGYLKSIPCSDRVKFLGRLSDDDMRCHYHAADVFAFPSNTKAEAFGIALAEGMYCECAPVSCTIVGSGVNWVSISNETGIEVPINDEKAFAGAIDKLLSDDDLRLKYVKAAKQRVEDNFTKERAIAVMERIYAEMV
jgi:rhamnosyl/mannosyltransferase